MEAIRSAFGWRSRPAIMSEFLELSPSETQSLESIFRLEWDAVSADSWELHYDTVSWFFPEAFCYYLPGICKTSIDENSPNLIAVTNVISMLDRSPNPDWWDDFFLARWSLLTVQECAAIQGWVYWLSSCSEKAISDDSLMRALETLELLKLRQA